MDEWQSVEFVLLAVMRKADLVLGLVAYNAGSLHGLATPLRELHSPGRYLYSGPGQMQWMNGRASSLSFWR